MEKPIRNYQVFTGSLFEMIDKAVGFVMSRIDARVGKRDQSADAPIEYELPESAVAEAIANAVAHRDYTSNASVQVMLFRDRLEVWSPGKLPYGITIEKLHETHPSMPTNPVLAHPLFLAGYIEHLGTGTTDMISDCEALGLRTPEFQQTEDFRTIIYRAEKVSDLGEKVTEQPQKVTKQPEKVIEQPQKSNRADAKSNRVNSKSNRVRLTAKQQKVLEFCDEIPHTAQEILTMIGVKYQTRTVLQYVTKLVLAGVLRPTTISRNDSNRKYITAHSDE